MPLDINTLPSSCGTAKNSGLPEKVDVGEFQLNLMKNTSRKDRPLKLCSNELHHSVIPNPKIRSIKKANSASTEKHFKTAQPSKHFFKHSGTGFPKAKEEPQRNKESKIASTEATRSFQAQGESSENIGVSIPKEATFDFSSIKSINQKDPLLEKRSPQARLLKKTMTFSRYDFGGIIEPILGTCPKKETSIM